MKLIDTKFLNYTDNTKRDIKFCVIFKKILKNITENKEKIKNESEKLKINYFKADNLQNKNLLRLNIEEEIKKQEFRNYIIDRINNKGKLNNSLDEKAKNYRSK